MIIYEDNLITAELPETGTLRGHITVRPKEEAKSVDELDAETVEHLAFAASYAATVLFETLGAQGTNIILNEEPVRYDIVARSADDTWSHQWSPQQLDQPTMEDASSKIQKYTPIPGQENIPEPKKPESAKEIRKEVMEDGLKKQEEEENYLIRQLHRVP